MTAAHEITLTSAWAIATALHPDIADIALRCPSLTANSNETALFGKTESGGTVCIEMQGTGAVRMAWEEQGRVSIYLIYMPTKTPSPPQVAA